jgi:hypothetical protein
VPEPVVRFVLGPPRAGERTAEFPMVGRGGLAGRWGDMWAVVPSAASRCGSASTRIARGRSPLPAAGVRIAGAHRGELSGATERLEIVFGVARPVRTMTLAAPLTIGPLAIGTLGVRTADYGSADGIRQEGDPDEVMVVGGKARPERDRLSLGADQLGRCSSWCSTSRASASG